MERERTTCPLRLIAHAAQTKGNNITPLCVEESCAWWNKNHLCCAIKTILPEYTGEAD